MSKKYFYVFLFVLLAFMSDESLADTYCTKDSDCLVIPGTRSTDYDNWDHSEENFRISPGIPASCVLGDSYTCISGVCVLSPPPSSKIMSDLCIGTGVLNEYISPLTNPYTCSVSTTYPSCYSWCNSQFGRGGTCKTANGWACFNPSGCGYCECEQSAGTPSFSVIGPVRNQEIALCDPLPINIGASDDGAITYINVWIATPVQGLHCQYWTTQLVLYNPSVDVHTFDCYRDYNTLNCKNLGVKEWDLSLKRPEICPVTGLKNPCAMMAEGRDNNGNTFSTQWTYFYINSCGDGICDPFENSSNCLPDCKYTFMNQLSKIFNMVKMKIKVWR